MKTRTHQKQFGLLKKQFGLFKKEFHLLKKDRGLFLRDRGQVSFANSLSDVSYYCIVLIT